jgi:hypothetical protein
MLFPASLSPWAQQSPVFREKLKAAAADDARIPHFTDNEYKAREANQ